MALKIETENKQQTPVRVIPGARLWLTRDGKRLVEDGHPEAYRLYCNGNTAVDRMQFEKLQKAGIEKVADSKATETKGAEAEDGGSKASTAKSGGTKK